MYGKIDLQRNSKIQGFKGEGGNDSTSRGCPIEIMERGKKLSR